LKIHVIPTLQMGIALLKLSKKLITTCSFTWCCKCNNFESWSLSHGTYLYPDPIQFIHCDWRLL